MGVADWSIPLITGIAVLVADMQTAIVKDVIRGKRESRRPNDAGVARMVLGAVQGGVRTAPRRQQMHLLSFIEAFGQQTLHISQQFQIL